MFYSHKKARIQQDHDRARRIWRGETTFGVTGERNSRKLSQRTFNVLS